ncbi:MAG: hypothetical protein JO327_13930 [Nitrososphaeraceae archaeon]|nr:hypothetical protein [Nitrososphaeraceae archaeon]
MFTSFQPALMNLFITKVNKGNTKARIFKLFLTMTFTSLGGQIMRLKALFQDLFSNISHTLYVTLEPQLIESLIPNQMKDDDAISIS